MADRDAALYIGCKRLVEESAANFEKRLSKWLDAENFANIGMILINAYARDCLFAGAIALRKYGDADEAFAYWRGSQPLEALRVGVEARKNILISENDNAVNADLRARDFLYLQFCLLFCGNRSGLTEVRQCYDLLFVQMTDDSNPDPIAAEARMQYASWEGDVALVAGLTSTIDAHYKRFKLSTVYSRLWRAVASRDSQALSDLLPEAEAAYKGSAKRKTNDIWGAGKTTMKLCSIFMALAC